MKKLLLLFTALLLVTSSYSQIIILLSEDFTGNTMPTGWGNNPGSGGSGTHPWSFGTGVMPGNANYHVDNFPNNAAIFDDDAAGDTGNRDQWALLTPAIDAYGTGGEYAGSNLKLRYQYAINNINNTGNNDFEDKINVNIYDDITGAGVIEHTQTTDPIYQWINLSDLVYDGSFNSSSLIIAWFFDDVDGSWGWGAGIDDVALIINPDNDACQDAIVIPSLPYSHVQNAIGSTNNAGFITPSGCGYGMNDGVWYTFTPTTSGQINISATLNILPNWDLGIGVYTGSCGNFTCVASVDDQPSGDGETINNLSVTAGTKYFINIGYYSDTTNEPEHKFMLQIDGNLSTPENNIIGFEMYPNPSKELLNLSAENNIDVVKIYNMIGQKVLQSIPQDTQVKINTSHLQTGAYIVKVQAGEQMGSYQLIKE